jgi:hypothetical protein
MQKTLTLLRTMVALACLAGAPLAVSGQEGKTAAGLKPKAGQETGCDGALEIVPRKPMSFARKRRPAAAANTTPAPRPEAKPERKPVTNSKP